MTAIALLGTHKCYDRGRGLCCVTCGNICDFVQLGTHRCYDIGRGTWCVTCGNIIMWFRPTENTQVLRQRTWCIRCFLWESWFRPTAWGHTRVTTEDVVRAVLPAGTFISDSAHIWGHTRVRSCDWYRPSGTHMYYDRGPCCVTCGIIVDNEAFIVFAADLVTYSLL